MRHIRFNKAAGFTLIEILVALVIIGIIVASATLAIGTPGIDALQKENRRLAALLGLAQEEAILQSRDFGLVFWENGYSFYEYRRESGSWHKLENDRLLRSRRLPEGMEQQLTLEGLEVTMNATEQERKKPQVFILSSGEMSPFKLRRFFSDRPDEAYTELESDALGDLTLSHSGQEDDNA